MNIDLSIKLEPGMILERFNSDFSALEQFKLVCFDESYKEYNPLTNKYEPLWEVSGRNGLSTRWYFESEIREFCWFAGQNHNIDYKSWAIN